MDAASRPISPFSLGPTVRPFRAVAGPVVTVADDDLDLAAVSIARQFEDQRDTLRLNVWLTGLVPVLYGLAAWLFGVGLVTPDYPLVPGPPQIWGTVFVVLGAATITCAERSWHRADAAFCLITALMLAMFMASFVLSGAVHHLEQAALPAISYAMFSLLYLGRARLAWRSRQA